MSLLEAKESGPRKTRGAHRDAATGGFPGGPEVSEPSKERKRKSGQADCAVDQSRRSSGGRRSGREEGFSGEKRILRSHVAKQRNGYDPISGKSNCMDQMNGEGFQVEKRVLRSDISKKNKAADTHRKKVVEEAVLRAEQNGNVSSIKESLRSDVVEQSGESTAGNISTKEDVGATSKKVREETTIRRRNDTEEVAPGTVNRIDKRNDTEHINCEVEIKVEKRTMRSDAGGQSKEVSIDRLKDEKEDFPRNNRCSNGAEQIKSDYEVEVEKRIKRSGIAKRREGPVIKRGQVEKKRLTRSCVAKENEDIDTNKRKVTLSENNITELVKCVEETKTEEKRITRSDAAKKKEDVATIQKKVSGKGLMRKRSREVFDTKPNSNNLKKQSPKGSQDQARQKHRQNERKMKPNPKNSSRLESEKIRWIKRLGQRTIKRLKDNNAHSVSVKKEDSGVIHPKGVGLRRHGRVQRFFCRNKKTGRFEKPHIGRQDEKSMRDSRPHSSGNQNALGRRSIYEGRKNLKKLTSSVSVGKNQVIMDKTPLVDKKICHELKVRSKQNNLDSSNDKNEITIKGQCSSFSETPLSIRQAEEEARIVRRIAKQKLRDQIKDILLKAGWKIDLRPRKGRGYDDSVYVSPKGSGYWSILKAYEVFQRQLNRACDDEGKNSLGKSSKMSRGSGRNNVRTGSMFSVIPEEALSILKKVVVNRRRSKAEMEEAKKKLENCRKNEKGKGVTAIKHPKSKLFKDNCRRFKQRKKNIMDSGDKDVGYTRKKPHAGRGREKRRGMALLARGSNQETKTGTDAYVPYIWRRTVLSWMIDLGIMPASCKVKYMNKNHTRAMLEGWITRNGIHCSCCSRILAVSLFEVHAGSKLCQPYRNLYLEEAGISLLQCLLNAWDKQDESIRQSFYSIDTNGDDPNDDTCGICGDGGDLICCDGCPSTFHLSCLGIQMLPPGNWHCMSCSCRFCGQVSSHDAQENDATVSPLLSCSQCEEKYHQKCIPEGDAIPVCSNLPYISFCGQNCKQLFEQLQTLLGVKKDLEAGFSLTLLQRLDEDLPESFCGLDQKVECNSKIAVALAVMDECFLPIIDQRSGINLIHNVVYNCGSNFNRLNYRGFYTFILERDDEIISVASLRIHGTRLAEMPFIGTRNMYRRRGMCRRLLNGIESALCSLNIEKLIIPAISELMSTWTNVFGFKPIEASQKEEIRSVNMLVFPGTGLLLKPLQKKYSSKYNNSSDGVDKFEPDCNHHIPEIVNETSLRSVVGLEPNASDEVLAQHEHEAEGIDPDSSEVSTKSCDALLGSEPHTLETASNQDLLLCPEAVHHDELLVDNNLQVASFKPQTELPSGANVHDNREVEVKGTCVVWNLHVVNGTLEKHNAETGCTSPDATASILHDSGTDTATNLPTVDCTFLTDLNESDEVLVQYEHEVKGINTDSSKVSTESCDALLGSEPHRLRTASNQDFLLCPEAVHHDEPLVDNNLQVASFEPQTALRSGANVHDNSEMKVKGTCVVRNLHVVNGTLEKHISETGCTSPDATASILHDSDTATNLPTVDFTFLTNFNEAQCTSLSDIASILQNSGVDAEQCASEVIKTELDIRSKKGYQDLLLCPEAVHHDDPLVDNNSQVASCEPQTVLHSGANVHNNSEVKVKGSCAVRNLHVVNGTLEKHSSETGCTSPDATASILHDSGADTATNLPTVDCTSLTNLNVAQCTSLSDIASPLQNTGMDAERCTSEVIKTELDIRSKKGQDSCMNGASYDTDVASIHAASVHSVERSVQHNSELQQKPRESLFDADVSFATDRLHHNKHDLVNSLNVTSLIVTTISFDGVNTHESCKPIDSTGYVEKNLSALNKSSGQCTTDMAKSLDVTFETNSLDKAYVRTPDGAAIHSLHTVAKGSALLTPGVTESCSSTEGAVLDNHSAVSRCAIAGASEDEVVKGVSDPNGVVSDYFSGGPSGKFSYSRVNQHDLAMTNRTAIDIPVRLSNTCYEGGHDTNNLKADVSAIKHDLHALGECSIFDASKLVSKSLDNGLQSTLEYADASDVQHSELLFGYHTSTSGIPLLSTGEVGSCEIHEVVSGADQGNSLVPRHDSSD